MIGCHHDQKPNYILAFKDEPRQGDHAIGACPPGRRGSFVCDEAGEGHRPAGSGIDAAGGAGVETAGGGGIPVGEWGESPDVYCLRPNDTY